MQLHVIANLKKVTEMLI